MENGETDESRNYGRVGRILTPLDPQTAISLRQFTSLDEKAPYTLERRLFWAKLRLMDYFARTSDWRAKIKADAL